MAVEIKGDVNLRAVLRPFFMYIMLQYMKKAISPVRKKYTIRSEWLRLSLYGIAIDRPGAPAHRPMGPAARAKQGSEIKSIKEEMLLCDTEKNILPPSTFPIHLGRFAYL